jgi:6-pyruvoyltetrahydropterin/6-carboxytetrahydropterin synthase
MRVSKTIEFDAAHRVPWHESKCKHLHGHRYKVTVTIEGDMIGEIYQRPDAGMVVDFGVIKEAMLKYVHDVYDHRTIVWQHDAQLIEALTRGGFGDSIALVPCIPTAENLAALFCSDLAAHLPVSLDIVEVAVHETATCVATWTA